MRARRRVPLRRRSGRVALAPALVLGLVEAEAAARAAGGVQTAAPS